MSLREEDFVLAARIAGVSNFKIIIKHLVPGFMSYLIVDLTLGIPGMILGETSMSFLGLGMRPCNQLVYCCKSARAFTISQTIPGS